MQTKIDKLDIIHIKLTVNIFISSKMHLKTHEDVGGIKENSNIPKTQCYNKKPTLSLHYLSCFGARCRQTSP